jgi:hypothetical protein
MDRAITASKCSQHAVRQNGLVRWFIVVDIVTTSSPAPKTQDVNRVLSPAFSNGGRGAVHHAHFASVPGTGVFGCLRRPMSAQGGQWAC